MRGSGRFAGLGGVHIHQGWGDKTAGQGIYGLTKAFWQFHGVEKKTGMRCSPGPGLPAQNQPEGDDQDDDQDYQQEPDEWTGPACIIFSLDSHPFIHLSGR